MAIELNDTGLEAAFTLENERSGIVDEPPFHILALGDWSGDGESRPVRERRPVEIDRDNFDDVMRRMNAAADLDFEDGSSLRLEFGSLDDFHPDEIFRRVGMFDQLRSVRKKLRSEDTYNSAAYEARQLFGIRRSVEETTADEPAADNLLDAILAKPEGGAAAPKPKLSGELGSLISELVRPHLVRVDEDEQQTLLSAVDSATSGLMRTILHHRKFQALEAAWRGLYFLVRRTSTSSDLKIFALDMSKADLTDDLKQTDDLTTSGLYAIMVRDAVQTPGGQPWAAVCADHSYSPDVNDIAALMRVAKIAAAAGAPFISHVRPDILGVHSLYEDPDPAHWNAASDGASAKLWFALRGQPEAVYLGMTMPRFLARLPYGSDTDPLENFNFEEFDEATEHDHYVWANGCFAATTLLAESFSESGWQMGRSLKQDLEGLPVHVYEDAGETVFKPCSEILMTDESVNKLMEAGLMPLVSFRSTDRVKLARFQSIADPVTGLRGRWSTVG